MTEKDHTGYTLLIREEHAPAVPLYDIEPPDIATGSTCFFTSGSGLRYESIQLCGNKVVVFRKKR